MSVTSLGPKPNVILFDDQINSPRPPISQGDLGRIPDVLATLGDLNKRILKIQIYQQVLRDKAHSLQNKGTFPINTNTSIQSQTHEQILNVMQRKLHMLVMQSNKFLQDLKDQIQRVLTKQIMERKINDYQSKNSNDKLQKIYLDKIKEMESQHSEQVIKIERKNQTIERSFEQRLQKMQMKLLERIKQLERKQQGYKIEIHRLKTETIDNKKFRQLQLQLQQTKVALKNLPQKSNRDALTPRTQIDKDTTHSRMRRNKIFEKKQDQIMQQPSLSPIRHQYSQVASINILSKQLQDLTSQLNHHFNNQLEQGSDQDVFFYPQSSKAQHMIPELQSSTKISSPFDLNSKY